MPCGATPDSSNYYAMPHRGCCDDNLEPRQPREARLTRELQSGIGPIDSDEQTARRGQRSQVAPKGSFQAVPCFQPRSAGGLIASDRLGSSHSICP